MATSLPSDLSQSQPQPAVDPLALLGVDSYTAHRLKHASPEHLYLTTRRCFIGPVPEGWLKSHRRDWYKHHLHIHYSSRSASFSAAPNTGKHRRLTGIDAPHTSSTQQQSFPQPQDLAAGHLDSEEIEESREPRDVVTDEPPALEVPRTSVQEPPVSPSQGNDGELIQSQKTDQSKSGDHIPIKSTSETPRRATSPKNGTTNAFLASYTSATKKQQSASLAPPTRPKPSKRPSGTSSFVTAHENPEPPSPSIAALDENTPGKLSKNSDVYNSGRGSVNGSSLVGGESVAASSTAPLINENLPGDDQPVDSASDRRKSILSRMRSKDVQKSASALHTENTATGESSNRNQRDPRTSSGLVRFNLPDTDDDAQKEQLLKVRLAQFRRRDTLKRLRQGKSRDGEIVKMDKMLVRVEFTSHEVQEEFDENDSSKIDARTLDKWREYMVVCRESANEDDDFVLQMYKSRVIHAIEKTTTKQRSSHRIVLNRSTRINIFSSLDKTIVLWEPFKQGHRIFIVKPRSGATSMEWYTFLRSLLGWDRPSMLQVNVPDLDVSLRIDHPFENLEFSESLAKAAKGDREALKLAMEEEKAAAGKIIVRCMKMLENSPEWGSIVDAWATPMTDEQNALSRFVTSHGARNDLINSLENSCTSNERPGLDYDVHSPVGLAWKRYDRLEWVHGANEQNMYGTIGMEKSHDLELRPKQHYPTVVVNKDKKHLLEPSPVEGFLVRLTSQRGNLQRLGKLFYKRLYFSTHNQYLVFNRPAQAHPPPPPVLPMRTDSKVPSASQIADKIPLIYAVTPYPLRNRRVRWLSDKEGISARDIIKHDQDAYDENQRKVNLVLKCDGIIDLCNVVSVRNMRRGATQADNYVDQGSEVDFDEEVADGSQEDGDTEELDDKRTFEIVLENGLVIRLQAYDITTKREWIQRLRDLVSYWVLRRAADISLYKSVRRLNLAYLKIDEDIEAAVGQFARKWEVRQSYASPELYHMCGISCCRTIQMSGVLYRKARLHASFERCQVILSHGHLLVFEAIMRNRNGKMVPHIQHQRLTSLDLSDCYIYSGLITSEDLLYTSSGGAAPDRSHPGSHRGLPRMYLEDGWSSTDEDTMTCFVVWHGKHRSWFRTEKAHGRGQEVSARVKMVRTLGKQGRSVVFKTRSRAERDHWVMSIGMEIERTATKREAVRIVK